MNVTFITGNQHKADHMAQFLGLDLAHQKVSVDEIQSDDPRAIVEHKARQAYDFLHAPVFVEDVSLEFNVLNGLPGPFIKFFIENENGAEILCRMLDGFTDRSATARCVFGYYDGKIINIVEGTCPGVISESPRGDGGYGWDAIFEMDGMNGRTNAELSNDRYDEFQKKLKPFDELRAVLIKAS